MPIAEITLEEEAARWKSELQLLKDQGNRLAKTKLKELEAISPSDLTGVQNWVASLFWMARRNEKMGEAQAKVNKEEGKPEGKKEVAPATPRRKFKGLGELTEHYQAIKSLRLDGKVHSSSLEVLRQVEGEDDRIILKVKEPTDPGSGQTIPPGEYRMLNVGVVTFCRRLGMSYTYFNRYPKRDEIVEHMNVLNREQNTQREKDYVLRLLKDGDGYVVQAVVPKNFVPIDNADILGALGTEPILESFIEGPFDRAIDVMDIRLPGTTKVKGYYPLLRIVNSEVDMSPVLYGVGVLSKGAAFVSMARAHGAVRITHRGKSGDIKDWLQLPKLIPLADPVASVLESVVEKPISKAKTTEFLVHKLGIIGTDIEAFLADYFVAHPGPDTLWAYAQGLSEASKVFTVSKQQKLCDLSMALVYGDIPVVV